MFIAALWREDRPEVLLVALPKMIDDFVDCRALVQFQELVWDRHIVVIQFGSLLYLSPVLNGAWGIV